MKKRASTRLSRIILDSYTTLRLHLLQFIKRLKPAIGESLIGERPQMLGRLKLR